MRRSCRRAGTALPPPRAPARTRGLKGSIRPRRSSAGACSGRGNWPGCEVWRSRQPLGDARSSSWLDALRACARSDRLRCQHIRRLSDANAVRTDSVNRRRLVIAVMRPAISSCSSRAGRSRPRRSAMLIARRLAEVGSLRAVKRRAVKQRLFAGWWLRDSKRAGNFRTTRPGPVEVLRSRSLVRAEIVEPIVLGQPIEPLFLGNFGTWQILARSRCHRFKLSHGGSAESGIAGSVFDDQLTHKIRSFQHDTSARGARR